MFVKTVFLALNQLESRMAELGKNVLKEERLIKQNLHLGRRV